MLPMNSRSTVSLVEMSMFITKATQDPKTGERRWAASASNTGLDAYGTRMSVALFNDFVRRINAGELVPEQFRSKAWQGGQPYVSIAHYPDLDGWGIVGRARETYVDGTYLKAKGTFDNPDDPALVEAAYQSVKADIANNVPVEQRVRISIAFLDWQHIHNSSFVFTRHTLDDKCPQCEAGIGGKVFDAGQLVQLALTRVPATKNTSVELEEQSMTTQLADAASIVGEELAEELDKRTKGELVTQSEAVIVRSDTDMDGKKKKKKWNKKAYSLAVQAAHEAQVENCGYEPMPAYGGALTVSEAQEYQVALEEKWRVQDLWRMLSGVMDNILDADEETVPDMPTAVKTAISDFQEQLVARSLVALANYKEPDMTQPQSPVTTTEAVPVVPHPLDGVFTTFRTAYDQAMSNPQLDRTGKLTALQPAMNQLGDAVLRSVSGSTLPSQQDLATVVRTELQALLGPWLAVQGQIQPQGQGIPQQRSITSPAPNAQVPTVQGALPAQPPPVSRTKLQNAIRRSVGLPAS